MISSESTFRILSLCARDAGTPAVYESLRTSIELLASWDALIADAEEHGLDPLLLMHLREAAIDLPPLVKTRLQTRCVQHGHAYAVRTRVTAEAIATLRDAGIPVLVLKGAALAHLVYREPMLRPMRDVDLLVRRDDGQRAWRCLQEIGFSCVGGPREAAYHHLQPVAKTVDGAMVTIEIHHELLRATPFVAPVTYDHVARRAQPFHWNGTEYLTLSREDMLWHVYAHAFVINVLRPGIRLISIADLVSLTEAWTAELDWERVEHEYGRAFRALLRIHQLTPWSPRVLEKLGGDGSTGAARVRPIASSVEWRGALTADVWWPPEWWFGMRYGSGSRITRLWHRAVAHPACVMIVAGQTTRRRLMKKLSAVRT
jgi:hypothetical protein